MSRLVPWTRVKLLPGYVRTHAWELVGAFVAIGVVVLLVGILVIVHQHSQEVQDTQKGVNFIIQVGTILAHNSYETCLKVHASGCKQVP